MSAKTLMTQARLTTMAKIFVAAALVSRAADVQEFDVAVQRTLQAPRTERQQEEGFKELMRDQLARVTDRFMSSLPREALADNGFWSELWDQTEREVQKRKAERKRLMAFKDRQREERRMATQELALAGVL